MKAGRMIPALAALLVSVSAPVFGQSLERRHQIEVRVGMWGQTTGTRTAVGTAGVSTTVDNNGFVGGIAYGYWLKEHLALQIAADVMAAKVENEVSSAGQVTSETATVSAITLGLKYYLPRPVEGSTVRPYLRAAVGPYVGSQTSTEVGTTVATESRREAAFGGQLAGGVDFLLSRRFLLGVTVGYNQMADFDQSIGGSRNFSGPMFGLGFSLLLGRGI